MDCKEAIRLFEDQTGCSADHIERCGVGIANYVFIVSAESQKYVLRCSTENEAYKDTVYWLKNLAVCEIPIPTVLAEGKYNEYEYVILTYIEGEDIGNIYHELNDSEKEKIAKEVVAIQKKVSKITVTANDNWTWNNVIDDMLTRSYDRIGQNHYFDVKKVDTVRKMKKEIEDYISSVQPIPYLDDISTKNLLIDHGRLSGIIDIDWMGQGDMLTFVAMTKVALLNMDFDTKYADYLLAEIKPDKTEYKAFIFYCLMFCVDFMGERGMQFLDKTIPVNEKVIDRLNGIFNMLVNEWNS